MTRKKNVKGNVLKIELESGKFALAVVSGGGLVSFFDATTIEEAQINKPMFSIWVMERAIKSRDWKKVGHIEIGDNIDQHPAFFKRDIVSGKFYKTYDSAEEIPITKEESKGLECAAVWSKCHVEDRLNDYFAGVPNGAYQRMRP